MNVMSLRKKIRRLALATPPPRYRAATKYPSSVRNPGHLGQRRHSRRTHALLVLVWPHLARSRSDLNFAAAAGRVHSSVALSNC